MEKIRKYRKIRNPQVRESQNMAKKQVLHFDPAYPKGAWDVCKV